MLFFILKLSTLQFGYYGMTVKVYDKKGADICAIVSWLLELIANPDNVRPLKRNSKVDCFRRFFVRKYLYFMHVLTALSLLSFLSLGYSFIFYHRSGMIESFFVVLHSLRLLFHDCPVSSFPSFFRESERKEWHYT